MHEDLRRRARDGAPLFQFMVKIEPAFHTQKPANLPAFLPLPKTAPEVMSESVHHRSPAAAAADPASPSSPSRPMTRAGKKRRDAEYGSYLVTKLSVRSRRKQRTACFPG